MQLLLDTLSQFAEALSIIVLLAWTYGNLHRRFGGRRIGAILLGTLFGLVAVAQMHAPIEPFPGVIVDLRVVPIVLAGAFLGSEGLLICLVLATAARVHIGGVGMEAGVASIMISGLVGLFWSAVTSARLRRGPAQFFGLALLACTSVAAGALLPGDLASWFLKTVVPAVIPIYLLFIPLVAALMERARVDLTEEADADTAAYVDPASGLPTKRAVAQRIASLAAAASPPPITAVLVLRLQQTSFLRNYWGQRAMDHTLSGMRVRIEGSVRHSELIGRGPGGVLLVGLTDDEAEDASDVITSIRRSIAERNIALPGGDDLRISASSRLVRLSDPASTDAILKDLTPPTVSPQPFRRGSGNVRKSAPRNVPAFKSNHEGLFDRLEGRMPQQADQRDR